MTTEVTNMELQCILCVQNGCEAAGDAFELLLRWCPWVIQPKNTYKKKNSVALLAIFIISFNFTAV